MKNAGGILSLVSGQKPLDNSFEFGKLQLPSLMTGEILVKLSYTSLSYKDSLSHRGIRVGQRQDSLVLGTDAVGTITESMSSNFSIGDQVLCVANSLGTEGPGGLSEYLVCLDSEVVRIPKGWTEIDSISLGTPGLTACLALIKLGLNVGKVPDHLVVSGASGSVGSLAIELASGAGVKNISAITSKPESSERLKSFGATSILKLSTYSRESSMNLLSERWDGGVDTLGGEALDNILKSTWRGGKIISVGRALSDQSMLSLAPLYIRGVSLIGANLELEFTELQSEIFQMLQENFPKKYLCSATEIYELNQVPQLLSEISSGGTGHRCLINLKKAWS